MPRPWVENGLMVGKGAAMEPSTIAALTTGQIPVGVTGYPPAPASITTTVRAVPALWVRVHNSGVQAFTDTNDTAVTFDTEEFDTDAMHSTSANTSRLTCVSAGVYAIGGGIEWAAGTLPSQRFISIFLNQTTRLAKHFVTIAAGGTVFLSLSTVYALAVNDFVEMTAITIGDGTQNATGTSFWAVRLGA